MKILCTIDFSETSLSAAKWINLFLEDLGGGEITFLHCMSTQHRAIAFNPLEDIMKENAIDDIKRMTEAIKRPSNTYKFHVVKADPKSYTIEYASQANIDWIVTGTKGLTALKDMTVGSFTEYCINESHLPVISIPANIEYKTPKKIVLGIDHKIIENESILKPLKSITNVINAELTLLHIRTKKDDILEFDPTFEIYFSDINYKLQSIAKTGTISETLNKFCDNDNTDLMCLIHHKRNWFQQLFEKSTTKQELFEIKLPLFLLPE